MSSLFIEAESFREKGGWLVDQQSTLEMGSPYLMAHGLGVPVADAVTTIDVPQDGTYSVYARTRDWTAPWHRGTPAGRFTVLVDGQASCTLGNEGEAWHWQAGGSFSLTAGKHTLALHDLTGFNGRCDAVFLSTDTTPPDEAAALAAFRDSFVSPTVQEDETIYDLLVAGGGVAGICAALSAARMGLSVLLIHDRAVLGGCNSSEIRVCMGGLIHCGLYPNLGHIVKEIEPIFGTPDVFDAAYFEDHRKQAVFRMWETKGKCRRALQEQVIACECEDGHIRSATALSTVTGQKKKYRAHLYVDCTGDAVLSRMAGAATMYGREAKETFGESLGAPTHEKLVMGQSIRWYSEKASEPISFPDIDFALPIDEATCLHVRNGDWEQESGYRRDMGEETEYIRDYGLLAIFSNWSWQKNHSPRRAEYARDRLVWASHLGGKRESYRVLGDYVLHQNDIENRVIYPDATASLTWDIDMHFPELKNETDFGEAFRSFAYHRGIREPYPMPYRCLYARDVDNLFLGGRTVSCSHVAFSSVRVMRTLGMLGEVVGLAAAICRRHDCLPRAVYEGHLDELRASMQAGVPSPDSFEGACDAKEGYHFKDAGWIWAGKSYKDNPHYEKIRANILRMGLDHLSDSFTKE
jgi:hypothetical protein